ncbi:TRAP transporter small permease [Pelagibius sp. Alg239-R121]|uniref:TRAP transporter small permease n=1 Tax=Pelagibius sp. Alg239-R121 TaxID=2993448 RepID=UPI0024A72182|nr:TRAP transporter small permease [Pelagibius sp. Alg239-R121]
MLKLADRIVQAVAVLCLIVSTAMICSNVFYRYVVLDWLRGLSDEVQSLLPLYEILSVFFGSISVTADEVPGLLLVWIAFLGAYMALRRGGHIAFDLLVERLPPKPQAFLRHATDTAILVFLALLFFQSIRMIRVDGATEIETAEIAQGWFMLIMPLAAVLLGLAILVQIVERRRPAAKSQDL